MHARLAGRGRFCDVYSFQTRETRVLRCKHARARSLSLAKHARARSLSRFLSRCVDVSLSCTIPHSPLRTSSHAE